MRNTWRPDSTLDLQRANAYARNGYCREKREDQAASLKSDVKLMSQLWCSWLSSFFKLCLSETVSWKFSWYYRITVRILSKACFKLLPQKHIHFALHCTHFWKVLVYFMNQTNHVWLVWLQRHKLRGLYWNSRENFNLHFSSNNTSGFL